MDKDTVTFGKTDSEKLKNDLEKVQAVTQKMHQQKEDLEKERGRILERIDELSRLKPVVRDRYVSATVERELGDEVEGADQTAKERTIADLKVQLAEIDLEMPLLERQKMLLEEKQKEAQKSTTWRSSTDYFCP